MDPDIVKYALYHGKEDKYFSTTDPNAPTISYSMEDMKNISAKYSPVVEDSRLLFGSGVKEFTAEELKKISDKLE